MVAYLGMDQDRGCDIIWNVLNTSNLDSSKIEKLYCGLKSLKNLKYENINTLLDVWKKDNSMVFISDSFFAGSIRQ